MQRLWQVLCPRSTSASIPNLLGGKVDLRAIYMCSWGLSSNPCSSLLEFSPNQCALEVVTDKTCMLTMKTLYCNMSRRIEMCCFCMNVTKYACTKLRMLFYTKIEERMTDSAM